MKLKKVTAMLALMAGFVFSQSIAQAETTLFDIDFSRDYGTAGNGTYSSAELQKAHSAVTDTWQAVTKFEVDSQNGLSKMQATKSARVGIEVSTGAIKSGIIDFDFKFRLTSTNGGASDIMRRIRINDKDIIGTSRDGQKYFFISDTTNQWLVTTSAVDLGIVLQRADEASDWILDVYNNDTNALLASTTLSAADYPSITTFALTHQWAGTASKDNPNISLYTLKGTHSEIEKAKLEVSENFDVTGEIAVIYPESITPSENMTCELKEKGATESILLQSSWHEANKLVITPLKYLDYDKDYVLLLTGTTGESGAKYDGTFTLKTKKEDISVKNQILTYLDAENAEVSQTSAVGAEAKITVSNAGGERELMAVITAFDENGKLLNTNATEFSKSSETEIHLTAKMTGEQSLSGTTVKTLVLEKLDSGIIIAVK